MAIYMAERQHRYLSTADGTPLIYGKLRTHYDLCWYCQFSSPEALVQGAKKAWYHLHPGGKKKTEKTYSSDSEHAVLLRELHPDEWEALFEMYG